MPRRKIYLPGTNPIIFVMTGFVIGLFGCQKSKGGTDFLEIKEPLGTFFDTTTSGSMGDFNQDGFLDTVSTVRVDSTDKIKSLYTITVPENSNTSNENPISNWGLVILLGVKSGRPEKKDSLFFPAIGAVIYDQGNVEIVNPDTLGDSELSRLAGGGNTSVISLFTQAGIWIHMYFAQGKFHIYWPQEEP